MARLPMRSGFTLIPEGEYVFRIYDVEYDEEYGKLKIHLVNAKGMTLIERYSLIKNDGEYNEGALNAFSYFARTALGSYDEEDIDPTCLVDHFIKAEVIHNKVESTKREGEYVTFVNLGDKSFADDFDETPCEKALTLGRENKQTPVSAPKAKKSNSTSDLLGLLDD